MDAQLRADIIDRDGGCIARFTAPAWAVEFPMFQDLPEPGPCRSTWGEEISPYQKEWLTIEEVKPELRMGVKAGYSMETCISVCPGHHQEGRGPGAKWCTKAVVRAAVRKYIPVVNERRAKMVTS